MKLVSRFILIVFVIGLNIGCVTKLDQPRNGELIRENTIIKLQTQSYTDSSEVGKIIILFYEENGLLFLKKEILPYNENLIEIKKGMYNIYLIANYLNNINENKFIYEDSIKDLKILLSSYSDLENNKILVGRALNIVIGNESRINLSLSRIYSKLSIHIDTTQLNSDVKIKIKRITLNSIPKYITPFKDFKALDEGDLLEKIEFTDLTEILLTQNMQGVLLPSNSNQKEKIPPYPLSEISTNLEIETEYISSIYKGVVKYRIYLGENNTTNFNIKRGVNYILKIIFNGQGLDQFSWRISEYTLKQLITHISLFPKTITFTSANSTFFVVSNILPQEAEKEDLVWVSSNSDVCTVDSIGTLYPVSNGSCKITTHSKFNPFIRDSIQVFVDFEVPDKKIETLNIVEDSLSFIYQESLVHNLSLEIYPINATNQTITWSSSDSTIATISTNGTIYPKMPGITYIKAESKDGSHLKDSVLVRVRYADAESIVVASEFDSYDNISKVAPNFLIDKSVSEGVFAEEFFSVRILPKNANQNLPIIWSLEKVENDPTKMASIIQVNAKTVKIRTKSLITVNSNRGPIMLKIKYGNLTHSLPIRIYESVPIKFLWSELMDLESNIEIKGIMPQFKMHLPYKVDFTLPLILIQGSSGYIYSSPQIGEIWNDPFLPQNFQSFLSEFQTSRIINGYEFSNVKNCYYYISQ